MKTNIVAPVLGNSGYAVHARNLGLALDKLGHDVAFETLIDTPNWQALVTPRLQELITRDYQDGVQVIIMPPPYSYAKSGCQKPILQYAVFEGTKIPVGWKLALNEKHVTRVIAPSSHTERACRAGGCTKPIDVIPHGVNTDVFNPEAKPLNPDADKFTFAWCKGWSQGPNDRSALDVFLRAFAAEFQPEEKVRAIVKINAAYANIDYALAIRNLQIQGPAKNKISLISNELTEQDLAGFYTSADVFVSISRGDAFDMPALEAMACGLPLIYSTHNGHEDFALGWPVEKGKFIKPGDPNYIYEECQWWETNQAALQEKMRYCFENPSEVQERGKLAANHAKNFSWKNGASKLYQSIEKALQTSTDAPQSMSDAPR